MAMLNNQMVPIIFIMRGTRFWAIPTFGRAAGLRIQDSAVRKKPMQPPSKSHLDMIYMLWGKHLLWHPQCFMFGGQTIWSPEICFLLVGERRSSYWCCHVQGSLPHGRKASVAFWELCSQNFCRCQGKNWVHKSRQYPTQKSDGLSYYVPNLQFFHDSCFAIGVDWCLSGAHGCYVIMCTALARHCRQFFHILSVFSLIGWSPKVSDCQTYCILFLCFKLFFFGIPT